MAENSVLKVVKKNWKLLFFGIWLYFAGIASNLIFFVAFVRADLFVPLIISMAFSTFGFFAFLIKAQEENEKETLVGSENAPRI